MKQNKGFPYKEKKKPGSERDWCPYTGQAAPGESFSKYKRKRVRCPVCKRRMIAQVKVCSAGCCIGFHIPRHKDK